jgi:hypothetical protein
MRLPLGRHYWFTALLVLLAFAAGWFWHGQYPDTHPVQSPVVAETNKAAPAIDHPLPDIAIPLPPAQVQTTETPESALRSLLLAREYQRAVDFYRDRLQEEPADTNVHFHLLIQAYLEEQLKQENFTDVVTLCHIFLDFDPHDYPVTLAGVRAHLALGQRRPAIELLYAVVRFVPDETEQAKILDRIHQLVLAQYEARSHQQQWKELDDFYEYLLTQESTYWQYYLNDGVVLMNLKEYVRAEGKLLLLVDREGYQEQARQLLARIKLLQTGGSVLPLQRYGNSYVSPVKIGGVADARLVLDTGASVSAMTEAVFRQIPAQDYDLVRNSVTLHTANGSVVTPVYRIHEIELGNYHLENVDFAILPADSARSGFDGLLGMNILDRFYFEIDQQNEELVLQPQF